MTASDPLVAECVRCGEQITQQRTVRPGDGKVFFFWSHEYGEIETHAAVPPPTIKAQEDQCRAVAVERGERGLDSTPTIP